MVKKSAGGKETIIPPSKTDLRAASKGLQKGDSHQEGLYRMGP